MSNIYFPKEHYNTLTSSRVREEHVFSRADMPKVKKNN
jgi:hypothetical protein